MRVCANCGVELEDDASYCSVCDTLVEPAEPLVGEISEAEPAHDEQQPAEENDRKTARIRVSERVMGATAYVLFFIPLVFGKGEFVKFHTNRGAVIFLGCVSCVAVGVIPYAGVAIGILGLAFNLLCLVAGAVGAAAGKMIKLPVIDRFSILK